MKFYPPEFFDKFLKAGEKPDEAITAKKSFEPLGAYSTALFLALMHLVGMEKTNLQGLYDEPVVWRSRRLRDGSKLEGGFVAGLRLPNGETITALLREEVWQTMDDLELLCDTLPQAEAGVDTFEAIFDMIKQNACL
jgi:hypothetical protein